jgi:hypothetical protein
MSVLSRTVLMPAVTARVAVFPTVVRMAVPHVGVVVILMCVVVIIVRMILLSVVLVVA